MAFDRTTVYDYYTIFTQLRTRVSDVLSQNSNFSNIYQVFKDIERYHRIDQSVIANMLLGKIGNEYNKQMALFSIPTTEFMKFVDDVKRSLHISSVTELYAGVGLFASMYDKYLAKSHDQTTRIRSYDGHRYLEVTGFKYFDVQHKSLEKFILERVSFQNDLCVAILPEAYDYSLDLFLTICEPKAMIIVVPFRDCNIISENLERGEYSYKIVNTKLITYYDHFDNPDVTQYVPNTRTFIVTKNNYDLRQIGYFEVPIEPLNKFDYLFTECIYKKLVPYWMIDLPRETQIDVLRNIYDLVGNIPRCDLHINFHKFLSSNIHNLSEFNEYIEWKPRPPVFCTPEKFKEYKRQYQKICNGKPLSYFHRYGIIPIWVRDIDSAKIFLYLEYERQDKMWKVNETTFNVVKQPLMVFFN